MIVVDELYDDFVEQFTAAIAGHPGRAVEDTRRLRPALPRGCRGDNLLAQIQDAVAKGRHPPRRRHGFDRPGAFAPATVLTDVTPEMRAYREELFGPAAVVYQVGDEEEAVQLANDSTFGLGRRGVERRHRARPSRSPTGSTSAWPT